MSRELGNFFLGDAHRRSRDADSGNHAAAMITHRRRDASHAFLALLIVDGVSLRDNLAQIRLELGRLRSGSFS